MSEKNIPFDPETVIRLVTKSLSHGADAQPQLKNPTDAIAIYTHACLLSIGFRLLGLSEDDRLETAIDAESPRPLPAAWNATPGTHCFHYAHTQSSLTFLLRVSKFGPSKTVLTALALGDDKTTTFDIPTNDYISSSAFPYYLPSSSDVATVSPALADGFISATRMRDLATLVKINIVQKLAPGLVKEGYEEEPQQGSGSLRLQQQHPLDQRRPDDYDPLRIPRPHGEGVYGSGPHGPPPIPSGGERPPGFDDEYEIMHPRHGYGGIPGRNPLSIGADDLNPPGLGPDPPLRGPFFGEGGVGMGMGMGPMGGMHPGPDHPMFGGIGGVGGVGGYGSGGRGRAPLGARYDPVGPGDEPGGLRGPRGPQGGPGSGAPFNPFSQYGSEDFM